MSKTTDIVLRDNHLLSSLETLVASLESVNSKKYWMIRTDDGANYDIFSEYNFVALNLREFPTAFISEASRNYPHPHERIVFLKQSLRHLYEQRSDLFSFKNDSSYFQSNMTRLANQIDRVVFQIHQGDIILIPSRGASLIKIGKVVDEHLITEPTLNRGFAFARKIQWLKTISKKKLDPSLYRALGAHQAVSDITPYAEFIERNYNSYFVVNDISHYVLTLNSPKIGALAFTESIYRSLETLRTFSETYNLGIDVENINLSISLNSPGKIDFHSTARNAVMIMAVVSALCGGTLRYGELEISNNGVFQQIVSAVNNYLDSSEERRQKKEIFNQQMRSLEAQSVESWNSTIDNELEMIQEEDGDDPLLLPED
jgi:predicted Mrr-cat superfamily restriction endonuclease